MGSEPLLSCWISKLGDVRNAPPPFNYPENNFKNPVAKLLDTKRLFQSSLNLLYEMFIGLINYWDSYDGDVRSKAHNAAYVSL
jgi:hypothetical protein